MYLLLYGAQWAFVILFVFRTKGDVQLLSSKKLSAKICATSELSLKTPVILERFPVCLVLSD